MRTLKKMNMRILKIVMLCIAIIYMFTSPISIAADIEQDTDANCLTPADDQYLELRAAEVRDVEGQNKQIIMELWGHNLEFKGADFRFTYDRTKIETSSLLTNVPTSDVEQYFKFEDEFTDALELFELDYDETGDGMRGWLAFNPPLTESEHIVDKTGIGKVIQTNENLLLGKMSFQMKVDEFDVNWFKLVDSKENLPVTGTKITLDGVKNYQKESTFRFTDQLASKNADLANLVLSTGEIDEEDSSKSTYKEYDFTPVFDKDTLKYEVTLMEYIDNMDIKAVLADEKSAMKIKVPKRDTDNNLEYEADGVTIKNEEKDFENDTPLEFVLNRLGEPDTVLTITVTAEDGKTTKQYELVIKRPYGTIKGSIQLGNDLRDSMQDSYGIYVEYIADVTLYKPDLLQWDQIIYKTESLDNLNNFNFETQVQSDKDDGSYVIYAIPGQYDLIMEKLGFLASVVTHIDLAEGEIIDLGNEVLLEGDVDRSGIIDLDDMVYIVDMTDTMEGDGIYEEKYDFGKKGFVSVDDLVSVVTNSDELISIVEY